MILKRRFLLLLLLCWPFATLAEDTDANTLSQTIASSNSLENAVTAYNDAFEQLATKYNVSEETKQSEKQKIDAKIKDATDCADQTTNTPTPAAEGDKKDKETDTRTEEEKQKALEEKTKAYEDAKTTEQSKENRTLTALTTAATGIGGMELAMGLSEQAADKEADANMAAYIATMRCTYGEGHQVKAGPDEIELPGANDEELIKLRKEYFTLASSLKERKEALGMKPGIESEEILEKSQTGLYDDESLSIDAGAYASLYRAQMLGSEADQSKIDEERNASKNRVIAGGVVAGAGVVGGIVGNAVINKEKDSKIKDLDKEKIEEKAEEIKTEIQQRKPEATAAAATAPAVATAPTTTNKPQCEDIDNCLETNGNSFIALTSNKCTVGKRNQDGSTKETKGQKGDCATLKTGEFEVLFDYGTIKGTSMCSSTPTEDYYKDIHIILPGNPTGSGGWCWCKVTDATYFGARQYEWLPGSTVNTHNESKTCKTLCPAWCARSIADLKSHRKALLGFYD